MSAVAGRYLDRKKGTYNCSSVAKRTLFLLLDELEDRVVQPETTEEGAVSSSQEDAEGSNPTQLSFKEKLYLKMKNVYKSLPRRRKQGLTDDSKRYLGGIDPAPLLRLKALLHTVQPSSAESERAFSAAGLFVNKIGNRMGDESLNLPCVIRSKLMSHARGIGQSRLA